MAEDEQEITEDGECLWEKQKHGWHGTLHCCIPRVFITLRQKDVGFFLPVLWQLCSHWWGSADTSYRMPSSVSLELTGHPVEERKPRNIHVASHVHKLQSNSEKSERVTHLPGSALRWLCKIPKDYIMGTLKWMDDNLLGKKNKTRCSHKIAFIRRKKT